MTISEFTLKSSDHEPARRFEVFTGSGRRREWLPEEKARIVAESYEAGATVSAVARRYALSLQQLFAWPKVHDGMMRLTAAQLSALLEGLDWRRVHEARRTRVPVQAG